MMSNKEVIRQRLITLRQRGEVLRATSGVVIFRVHARKNGVSFSCQQPILITDIAQMREDTFLRFMEYTEWRLLNDLRLQK
jgi:hypothetical protein